MQLESRSASGSTRLRRTRSGKHCSPEAVVAARETCHGLGIPHVTIDAREAFRRSGVQPFIEDYARGETPNPCTRCNGSFRFGRLLSLRSA